MIEKNDVYRCEHAVRVPLADGSFSVSLGPGKTVRLPRSLAESCDDLLHFRTLDEHAKQMSTRAAAGAESFLPLLRQLVRTGALVSRRELLARARDAGPTRDAAPDLSVVAFVTQGGRVDPLARAIESYLDNARLHGARCSIVVADESRSPAARHACRARLERIAARRNARIAYAGREEKERYALELAREADVPLEVARFALVGDVDLASPGANRNCHLLHSVDEALLFSDDDVHARFAAAPDDRGKLLALGPGDELLRFFPNRDAVLSAVQRRETNVLALHAAWLGRSLGDVVRAASIDEAIDAHGLTPRMMRHLEAGAGRVVMTTTGAYGDCGPLTHDALVMLPRMARRQLIGSAASFRLAMRTREVMHVVPRVTLDHPSSPWGTFGIDNRRVLPPFLPIGRGENATFAALARAACAEHYVARLPLAAYHAAEGRVATREDAPTLASLVAELVDAATVGGADEPKSRLRALGSAMRAQAALSDVAFDELVHASSSPIDEERSACLRAHLGRIGTAAPWWTEAAVELLARIEGRIGRGRTLYAAPVDVERGSVKRHLASFGAVLEAWPALVDAARALRARGVRLARPLPARLERDVA